MEKKIVLGSGKLYYDDSITETSPGVYQIPADEAIEVSEGLLGWIKGGATLEYTPEFYSTKDDLGMVSKKILVNEDVILKSGIMTWNSDVLATLVSTAVVTSSTDTKTRTVKIGGIDNYDGKKYLLRFVHEDKSDGSVIRITIIGSNESGLEIAFANDSETVINAEFKAVPHDAQGTLVIYSETTK